ncbi:MAG: hypothetical protein QOG16_919 [Actinomycetota bacterium]|nr:hypothetical protein [Actinomycetota bacterium]
MDLMSEAYRGGRARIYDLVRSLNETALSQQVPACPDWTVKELVAHLTGVAADSLSSNVAEMGRPDWTASQVEKRRNDSIQTILEEWEEIAKQIEPALDDLHPTLASALIGDLITHEHDLRGALGDPDARDEDAVVISASFYARNFGKRLKDAGLPTVIVEAGEHRWTAGKEQPIGSVRAPLFEMLRGLTGRRTSDEVKGFDWTIDAAPYLEVFSMYPVTQRPLNE